MILFSGNLENSFVNNWHFRNVLINPCSICQCLRAMRWTTSAMSSKMQWTALTGSCDWMPRVMAPQLTRLYKVWYKETHPFIMLMSMHVYTYTVVLKKIAIYAFIGIFIGHFWDLLKVDDILLKIDKYRQNHMINNDVGCVFSTVLLI